MDEITADWILDDGRILTLDPRRPVARALAVAGGRVVAAGTRHAARRWRGRGTRVIALRGATVVPGLVDAHAHMDREGLKSVCPSLARCRSIADVQDVIRRIAARTPRGEWIVTMPIGSPPFYQDAPGGLAERRWPTRTDLDAAAPEHPVYVRGIWGYWNKPPVYSIASSRALAAAGIARDTVAPKGVEILRDAAGEPTGVFVEHNAIQVLEFTLLRAAPRFTHAQRLDALAESQRIYASRGVTAVYEGHGVAPEVVAVYRESRERGTLRLRATLALSPTWTADDAERALPEIASWAAGRGLGDDRLRLGGVCLHFGGDPEVARILHASQPYTGWAGFVESANTRDAYARQARRAASLGLRVNTLVTRCLPDVLDVWEEIAATTPLAPLRWVLVHLNEATPEQLARIRRLGAAATTNPISYLWRSGAAEADKLRDSAARLLPHRSLARARIPFGLATDNKPANPWLAFQAAVERRDRASGRVLGADERLTRLQALAALTLGGAQVTRAESERGRLAPGYAADLTVLEHDPLTAPMEALTGQTARLTMVGGDVVWGDDA
ncbi:MAG TPA: amidohydrolase [Methylomirabilota bacterium]|nr:amidohydrolase [Methylomirabilota bacterium]